MEFTKENILGVFGDFRSAKKGLEFLTEAGFDTSGLDLSVKHEVMTLEVDKDLLGLPEGDKK